MTGILADMTNQPSDTLIQLFTKAPIPGAVKTRLIPELGEQGAAELHIELTGRMIHELSAWGNRLELWCASDINHPWFASVPHGRFLQQGDDLGQRMAHALNHGLRRASGVLLLGTDLPPVDSAYIEQAFAALTNHDLVLGPTLDGGYGLLGLRGEVPDIFTDIPWGSAEVLSATCSRLNKRQVDYKLLPLIWDVDTPEDLVRYHAWLDSVGGDVSDGDHG